MDISRKSQVYSAKNTNRVSLNEKSITDSMIDNQAKINHSGNSNVNVNVNVQIDTKAIAYALLCSSLAKKDLTIDEFQFALNKLEELTSDKQHTLEESTNDKQEEEQHPNRRVPWNSLFFSR
jgi:hypothetical protein